MAVQTIRSCYAVENISTLCHFMSTVSRNMQYQSTVWTLCYWVTGSVNDFQKNLSLEWVFISTYLKPMSLNIHTHKYTSLCREKNITEFTHSKETPLGTAKDVEHVTIHIKNLCHIWTEATTWHKYKNKYIHAQSIYKHYVTWHTKLNKLFHI